MIQLAEKHFLGRKHTSGAVGRAPQRPKHSLRQSVEVLGESPPGLPFGSKRFVDCNGPAVVWVPKVCKKKSNMWERNFGEGVWPCLDPWDSGAPARSVQGKVLSRTANSFFLIKREPVASNNVPSNPSCLSAETLKVCALLGLHLLAAGSEAESSGSQSPDLRGMWRQGCPVSPEMDQASETSFGCEECEHNNEPDSLSESRSTC